MKMEIYLCLSLGAVIGLVVAGWYMGNKASDGDYTFMALWFAAGLIVAVAGCVTFFRYV